jgi:Tfp pilus assembly protein PilF
MTALTRRLFTFSNLSVALVMLVTAAVYWRVLASDFVYWDDNVEIYANPHLKGISPETLRWMFFGTGYVVRYQPLTWLTWSIIYEFFQLRPFGYHLASWLLHSLNAGLVFWLIHKLLRIVQPVAQEEARRRHLAVCSALGALVWALHPLRVEAVAWASSFLHLQALFFLLIAALCYLEASSTSVTARRRRLWYWTSVASFGLSLLSYPISLGFVIVPVLLDWFVLKRFNSGTGAWREAGSRRIWLEKLPFLGVACLVLGITLVLRFNTSEHWARPASLTTFSGLHRVMQAFYIWAYYVWRPFLPFNLSPVYSTLVSFDPLAPPFLASAALVCLATLLLVWNRRRWPSLFAAWICYLLLLVPVLGLTEHPHYPSDRYSLVVGILWSLLLAAGLARWTDPPSKRLAATLSVGLATALCAGLTVQQIGIWKDSVTLFTHMIRQLGDDPYRADIYWRLGMALMDRGQRAHAVESFRRVLELDPNNFISHYQLANIFFEAGNWAKSRDHYVAALRSTPDNADLYNNLGIVLAALHDPVAAEQQFAQALRIRPDLASANYNLGLALKQQGKTNEAQRYFDKAEKLKRGETPGNP